MSRKGEPGLDTHPERLFGSGEELPSNERAIRKYRHTPKGEAATSKSNRNYHGTSNGYQKDKEASARWYQKHKEEIEAKRAARKKQEQVVRQLSREVYAIAPL